MLFAAALILALFAAMISRPLIALAHANPNLCRLSRAVSWRGRRAVPGAVLRQVAQLHGASEACAPDSAAQLACQSITAQENDDSNTVPRLELGSAEFERILSGARLATPNAKVEGSAGAKAKAEKKRLKWTKSERKLIRETLFDTNNTVPEATEAASSPSEEPASRVESPLNVEARAELKGFGNGDNLGTLMKVVISIMHSRSMERVQVYRDAIAMHPQPRNAALLLRCLLAACERASDLPVALQIVDDLIALGEPLCEASALALIRCYSDAHKFQEAFALVKKITSLGEGKSRIVHPLLEGLYRARQLDFMLDVLGHMHEHAIVPRDIQLALVIQLYLIQREAVPGSRRAWLEKVVECLTRVAKLTNGFPLKLLQQISAQANNQSLEQVAGQGILARNQEDLLGAIVDTSELETTGFLHAWNASYDLEADEAFTKDRLIASTLGINPSRSKRTATSSREDKHTASSSSVAPSSPPPAPYSPIISPQRSDYNISFELERFQIMNRTSASSSSSSSSSSSQSSNSRLVYIPSSSTHCPHCEGHVDAIRMTPSEVEKMRQAILAQVRAVPNQIENMNIFIRWLTRQKPFDYIIDGANVAYSNQNFVDGKFTYQQLALVVKQLESIGKRVLVILPACYAPSTFQQIPNSIRTVKKSTDVISADDLAFLDDLRRRRILYSVPTGGDDDWYWMMASLVSTDAPPPLVISNDNLRDHRLSFCAPLPFLRWKASRLVYHSFIFEPVDSASSTEDGEKKAQEDFTPPPIPIVISNEKRANKKNGQQNTDETSSDDSHTTNPFGKPVKVVLNSPTSFVRELQYEKSRNRWHIPASDREAWLCIKLD